jgi:hypothetical protein
MPRSQANAASHDAHSRVAASGSTALPLLTSEDPIRRSAVQSTTTIVLHCPASLIRFRILTSEPAPIRDGTAGLPYPKAQDVPESEGMLWRRNL